MLGAKNTAAALQSTQILIQNNFFFFIQDTNPTECYMWLTVPNVTDVVMKGAE